MGLFDRFRKTKKKPIHEETDIKVLVQRYEKYNSSTNYLIEQRLKELSKNDMLNKEDLEFIRENIDDTKICRVVNSEFARLERKIVGEINDDDELIEYLKNCESNSGAELAVSKIKSQDALLEIIKNNFRGSDEAIPRIKSQDALFDIAKNNNSEYLRLKAIKYLDESNQSNLKELANDSNPEVRMACYRKIDDDDFLNSEEILFDIARNGDSSEMFNAVGKIENQDMLVEIAKTSYMDNVRFIALNKITDEEKAVDLLKNDKKLLSIAKRFHKSIDSTAIMNLLNESVQQQIKDVLTCDCGGEFAIGSHFYKEEWDWYMYHAECMKCGKKKDIPEHALDPEEYWL